MPTRPGASDGHPTGASQTAGHAASQPIGYLDDAEPRPALVAPARLPGHLRPVINATGILLHDGLGRAPLSPEARTAIDAAAATCDVELDLASGRRGRRGNAALTALAAAVPAARAVHVVNNNAGAVMLAAMALAPDREIVISRGELVETADGFRLPELLAATGARLREVGTTNRTTLGDYADAIGPRTGFVLRMHPPSFRVVGLTARPALSDLAELCARRGVPLVGDPGSGLLTPDETLPDEPDASTWLRCGASLVITCGDKLLGGPQCGLVLGRGDLVDRMRRHPLARALRVGKLTLAALEATLRGEDNPVRRSLRADPAELRTRAERLAAWLRRSGVPASAVSSRAVVSSDGIDETGGTGTPPQRGGAGPKDLRDADADAGGPASIGPGTPGGHGGRLAHGGHGGHNGSPEYGADGWKDGLPSAAVALDASLAALLRQGRPAVLGRVEQGCCLLDLRSVPADLDPVLAATVLAAATGSAPVAGINEAPTSPPGRSGSAVTAPHARIRAGTSTDTGGWARVPDWARRTERSPGAGWLPLVDAGPDTDDEVTLH
ncbi:L-seryl-tRNA(Sec) selenium transferase [Frankia sp. CcI49]|uniref:L-seryl-tRNA(Sec) selenium transferase n=1 Tax=unclassified Frankia TaxID=2632575 RepID=UPI0006CA197B|nr:MULTISPECIES: L-seryl-tRNA(Sec) selenium transferase [unclassified Frankia]KPM53308.1 selenocysteine synthase [Frankia sp. R43]ONH59726.1 L-seryl-tRNA(Sec) selenium transferase [Frankia sp. CcI49]